MRACCVVFCHLTTITMLLLFPNTVR
jgi:hypothetical protein